MNWQDQIHRWQRLPEQRKLQLRWETIPDDVARSMAFEREPVDIETIRAIHARTEPPALLKRHLESSATQN